jgi:hypothetical protein
VTHEYTKAIQKAVQLHPDRSLIEFISFIFSKPLVEVKDDIATQYRALSIKTKVLT